MPILYTLLPVTLLPVANTKYAMHITHILCTTWFASRSARFRLTRLKPGMVS